MPENGRRDLIWHLKVNLLLLKIPNFSFMMRDPLSLAYNFVHYNLLGSYIGEKDKHFFFE